LEARKAHIMPQIHFNGKTYNDLAEMPATERELLGRD
jgi:hypothetical protein